MLGDPEWNATLNELLYSLVDKTLRGAHIHARLNTGDRWAICRSAKR